MAFDVQKMPIFVLMFIVNPFPGVSGLIIDNTKATGCDGSRANITITIDLQSGTIGPGSEIWYYEATVIAIKSGGMFSPQGNYTSRLHTYSTYGIALDSVTVADEGRYFYEFEYFSPLSEGFKTATATLTVNIPPSDNCTTSYKKVGNVAICELDQAANCGSPRLEPMWTHTSGNSFTVVKTDKYTCCARGSILTDCYRGSSTFCKTFDVAGKPECKLELGLALGFGLGIPCLHTVIIVVIFICTAYKYPYNLGLVLGIGLGVTFQVGWIIIASVLSTGNKCTLELGLGLGLSSGMLYGIDYIVSVIFVFFTLSIFEAIPDRVELGKGMLTGLLCSSVIGIIVVYLKYDKLKREQTCSTDEGNPQETNGKKPEQVPLEENGKKPEQVPFKQNDKKGKTNNSGPPAVHLGTQNKVDPNTSSKQTNDRQQPLPPVNTRFEDTPLRPLPATPRNGKINDQNVRGLSANFGDAQDLAGETPRPKRLLPLTPIQTTEQMEHASEEPKKKRKKKKKKDQINKETPEEENGKTDLRLN